MGNEEQTRARIKEIEDEMARTQNNCSRLASP